MPYLLGTGFKCIHIPWSIWIPLTITKWRIIWPLCCFKPIWQGVSLMGFRPKSIVFEFSEVIEIMVFQNNVSTLFRWVHWVWFRVCLTLLFLFLLLFLRFLCINYIQLVCFSISLRCNFFFIKLLELLFENALVPETGILVFFHFLKWNFTRTFILPTLWKGTLWYWACMVPIKRRLEHLISMGIHNHDVIFTYRNWVQRNQFRSIFPRWYSTLALLSWILSIRVSLRRTWVIKVLLRRKV